MAQPRSTAQALGESGSTSKFYSRRGLECEALTKDYFFKKGFEVLGQRVRFFYAEVDMVLQSPCGEIVMVEVKSADEDIDLRPLISKAQMRRLKNAALEIESLVCKVPRLHLAAVNQFDEIYIYEDILESENAFY